MYDIYIHNYILPIYIYVHTLLYVHLFQFGMRGFLNGTYVESQPQSILTFIFQGAVKLQVVRLLVRPLALDLFVGMNRMRSFKKILNKMRDQSKFSRTAYVFTGYLVDLISIPWVYKSPPLVPFLLPPDVDMSWDCDTKMIASSPKFV